MARKFESNVAFVRRIMEHSKYGAMAQLFIIDAIAKHSAMIAEMPVEKVRAAFGENSIVNADAWHGVAVEIKASLDARG